MNDFGGRGLARILLCGKLRVGGLVIIYFPCGDSMYEKSQHYQAVAHKSRTTNYSSKGHLVMALTFW